MHAVGCCLCEIWVMELPRLQEREMPSVCLTWPPCHFNQRLVSIPRHCLLSILWSRETSSHPQTALLPSLSQGQGFPYAPGCRASISQQESRAEPRAVTHSLYVKVSPCHSQVLGHTSESSSLYPLSPMTTRCTSASGWAEGGT